MKRLLLLFGVLCLLALAALAQTDDQSNDNGFLINMLQNRMSAPGRQIQLSGVRGLLSSSASVTRITISDDKGPWLTIDDAQIDWRRAALLLGRVNINRVAARQITWLRRAEIPPRPVVPEAETKPFALPELPVQVNLQDLQLDSFVLDKAVFGVPGELGVKGSLNLVRGALDADLAVRRIDPPGGNLDLKASFSNATRQLAIDLHLQEPKGGLISKLLRIENEPAIDLRVNGAGPIDQMDVDFALDADGVRIAGGKVALRARDDGLGFDVDLSGGLAPMIPPQYRAFFAGTSALKISGVSKTAGGVRIDALDLNGAVLDLNGRLDLGADFFPRSLNLTGSLGDPRGPAVVLPVPGGRTRLTSAQLYVDYGQGTRWNGLLVLDRLASGDIEAEDVTLSMGGLAQHLDDPAQRTVTINLEGLATGVWAADPDVARALGTRIDLFADAGLAPGGPLTVHQLQVSGNGLSIFTAGTLENFVYTGRNAVRLDDIAPFSGVAGRTLGGAIDFRAEGSVSPLIGGFDLTLDGTATDLRLDDPRLDRLLAGETTLSGRAVRDAGGIRTEGLRLGNAQLDFSSTGSISSVSTDIGFEARLTDLALIDPRLQGALTATGRAHGPAQAIAVSLAAAIPEGRLMDRSLVDARLGFSGTVSGRDVTGEVTGGGRLGDQPITVAGTLASVGDHRSVSGLLLSVGPDGISGDLARTGAQPITGKLTLRASDIAPLAALALTPATGALDATVSFEPATVGQGITVSGDARGLGFRDNRIGTLTVNASVADAFGVPLVNGTLGGSDLLLAGIEIDALSAKAEQRDPTHVDFAADGRLAVGTLAHLSGSLQRLEHGFALSLNDLRLRQADQTAELRAPATVTIEGGNVTLTPLALGIGAGSLTAQGSVGDSIDLALDITDLPLALANTVAPQLGLAGQVNGTARVTGPRTAPNVDFRLAGAAVQSAATRAAGLPPISVEASGTTTAAAQMQLDARIASGNGLSATAQGKVPLGPGNLDVGVALQAFPLVLVDRLAGGRGLQGTVTGRATVTGPLRDPAVSFDARGTGISLQMMRDNAVPALGITAAGSYQAMAVTITSAEISGGGGLSVTGGGRVPLRGPGLDVRAAGTLPLSLANPVLAARDAQASGLVRIDASARGSLAAPTFAGTVTLSDGTVVDPQTNLRLEGITIDAGLSESALVLHSFRANVAAGGNITASGRIGIGRGFPSDLTGRMNQVRYSDGSFLATELTGDLALRGPLANGAVISGRIDLGATEISIAEGLGPNTQATLDQVTHKRPPPRVEQTLQRAKQGIRAEPTSRSGGLGLDIRIRAPRQIFVRGRGLDVELGGEMTVRGTTRDLQPVGQFDLRRGRLLILGQRITFTEGSAQLVGNLDPQLHFVASSVSDEVTAYVTVEGRASAPKITFSSTPELPQDEVLSRLIFNRSTANLSPFQMAQLAAAAAELASGGGGNGLIERLRGSIGLDDLDVITQPNGSTAVRAGKYIDDRVYVDVQTGSDGVSRAQVNLDLNRSLSARGSVGTDGNTTIGLFYTRDY